MKVYVINCLAYDDAKNRYSDFEGTEGVWINKHHANQWVVQQMLKDKEHGDDCTYEIKEFEI